MLRNESSLKHFQSYDNWFFENEKKDKRYCDQIKEIGN
jgi:hypothetical protein